MTIDLISYERRVKINDDVITLYPLDVFLSYLLSRSVVSAKLKFNQEYSKRRHGSLILLDYKPMASFKTKLPAGFMPFIIEVNSPSNIYDVGYPASIEVNYVNKNIYLNIADLSRMIEADFELYKKVFCVTIIQFTTVKVFVFEAIVIKYKNIVNSRYEDEHELVERKMQTLIQMLESTNPTIRENFLIEDGLYFLPDTSDVLYPYIFLIPKGIVNEISNYLLTLYQQNYSIFTKLPAGFIPNENIQSPELQKFLEKLPLDFIIEAVIGTYGSHPAILLPKRDYTQYLTGNEHLINIEERVVVVFGNPQQHQQQNVGQNKEEGNSNIDLNIAERLGKEIQSIYESIIESYFINNEEKKNRLEKLNNVLDELGKAILDALKSQIPLDANELRKYAEDIKSAGLSYINNFEYYIDYYENHLTTSAKLEILVMLLHSIGNIMYDIGNTIKELIHNN